MKTGLSIVLFLAQIAFAQEANNVLPVEKILLRDAKLETEIAQFYKELRDSGEGIWRLEDRNIRMRELCVLNCNCFATRLNRNVLIKYPYKAKLITMLPDKPITILLTDGSRRYYVYHQVLMIENADHAMIIDPVVFYHTNPISISDWLKGFDNYKINKPVVVME